MPAGVVNVITTSRSGATVSAMLHDPRVRKLSFTGSTEVGRTLLKEAADTVINCSMELGGNAPFIVFDDADLDAALDGAMIAKMRNGGEACTAANRFYVQEGIREAFAQGLAQRMAAMPVGRRLRPGDALRADDQPRRGDADRRAGRRRGRARGAAAGGRQAAGARRVLLSADGARRRAGRCGDRAGGDLRPGRGDHRVRERGRGGGAVERQRVRADRLCLHRRPRARPARVGAAGGRHGRAEPRAGLGPGGAVRRRQAERARARGRRTTASSSSARPSTSR